VLSNLAPAAVLRVIEEQLDMYALRLCHEKTQVTETSKGFDYLGFHINTSGHWVTQKKVIEILGRISQAKNRKRRRVIVKGWLAYCTSVDYQPDGFDGVLLLIRSGKPTTADRMVGSMAGNRHTGRGAGAWARHSRRMSNAAAAGLATGVAIWVITTVHKLALLFLRSTLKPLRHTSSLCSRYRAMKA
jgi:hypothetical protein